MQDNKRTTMTGAQIVAECLLREGVDVLFAYPGGTSMRLHQALLGSGIRVILPRHEQGAAFAANGYARISGKAGVCMATSGPGATNLVTGIADAWNDSVPLVAITAQVNQRLIGKNAFQETDIVGVTRPIVKHSYLVLSAADLPEVIKDAMTLAVTGRPGPILIDITCDVLRQECEPIFPEQPNLRAWTMVPDVEPEQFNRLVMALRKCRRPCIYAGGGIVHAGAAEALQDFAQKWQIPVATSLMGKGIFPEDNPLSLRMLGMHGTYYANKAVNECDLLLAFGVRFSDRVTGEVSHFAPNATIVHVDIDASEINKNKHADIAINSDIAQVLEMLCQEKPERHGRKAWLSAIEEWKKQHELQYATDNTFTGPAAIEAISQETKGNATIVTGVGQHQMWTAQFYNFRHPRQLLTSGGLGAMGFGLPAALGAKLAKPDELVLLIDGDGSFQMNIQELATVFAEKIPLKMVLLNNKRLGMVYQWEELFFAGTHANTDMSLDGKYYPDFVTIAKGYGIPATVVTNLKDFRNALRKMLSDKGPFLIDARIIADEQVLPMIPAGGTCEDIITD
ncbi:MAG: biosynthetic-type acetolactate synthase large subunit [Victivallales bacterium]|nr:biosynthetic-type acetolactate synthase large subunit [Victivallales bacterium]